MARNSNCTFAGLVVLFLFVSCIQAFAPQNIVSRKSVHLNALKDGSIVALVTPFKEKSLEVDYDRLVALLDWHVQQGTDGVVILGTTGEASMINHEERSEIIKTSVRAVKGAIPVIVGAGTIETQRVIELSRHALQHGADASLIITPYYIKPPQRALVQHFKAVADAVSLPMILYNCPGRTGVDMKPETIAECAKHPNIIAVKDATGDLARVKQIRDLTSDKFLIYSGEDDSGCDFVALGGNGVISVTANVAPKLMHEMLSLSKQGKKVEADVINQRLMPLHQRLFLESNPIPVKKALHLLGRVENAVRPPLAELAPEHLPKLREALTHAHLL